MNIFKLKRSEPGKELTEAEKLKLKKLIIYPIFFLIFLFSMWLIFAPSSNEVNPIAGNNGFNTELPLPTDKKLIDSKKKAYENERTDNREKERIQSLFHLTNEKNVDSKIVPVDEPIMENQHSSVQTSKELNRQLTSFNTRQVDPEKEALKKKVQELTDQINEKETVNTSFTHEDQLAILERSYELAAKYMGNNPDIVNENIISSSINSTNTLTANKVLDYTISSLQNGRIPVPHNQELNSGFYTPIGATFNTVDANSIKACIYEDQTVMDGQPIKLRLLESMQIEGYIIPRNNLLTGIARITGDRMDIQISSLEYNGSIFPVELTVYDKDGLKGLFVPNSLERQAVNEGLAGITSGLGSSISLTRSASQQIAMDVTRGTMQGTSQYLSKKLRTPIVKLTADYEVRLLPKSK